MSVLPFMPALSHSPNLLIKVNDSCNSLLDVILKEAVMEEGMKEIIFPLSLFVLLIIEDCCCFRGPTMIY